MARLRKYRAIPCSLNLALRIFGGNLNRLSKSIAFLFISLTSTVAFSGTQTGEIVHLLVHWNGNQTSKFDVRLSGNADSQPEGCNGGRFVGLLDTEAAKAQYSMVLAASIASKKVYIQGQGYCSGNQEVIRNVSIVFSD